MEIWCDGDFTWGFWHRRCWCITKCIRILRVDVDRRRAVIYFPSISARRFKRLKSRGSSGRKKAFTFPVRERARGTHCYDAMRRQWYTASILRAVLIKFAAICTAQTAKSCARPDCECMCSELTRHTRRFIYFSFYRARHFIFRATLSRCRRNSNLELHVHVCGCVMSQTLTYTFSFKLAARIWRPRARETAKNTHTAFLYFSHAVSLWPRIGVREIFCPIPLVHLQGTGWPLAFSAFYRWFQHVSHFFY